MLINRIASPKFLAVLSLGAIIAVSGSGFAAANTVPTSKAGDGNAAISGYAVTNVHYTLNSTNPTNIDAVSFTLDSAPVAGSTIKVKLVSTGSDWYTCTTSGTPAVNASCTTTSPQATVLAANDLRVVVAD
ncbi:MAG TPA: hypothetical protein VFN74_03415 [Chloroflexota bacterium]|jgi:hypothetical protein|nr:hypothetical protein [Chloroflexota bacterium]